MVHAGRPHLDAGHAGDHLARVGGGTAGLRVARSLPEHDRLAGRARCLHGCDGGRRARENRARKQREAKDGGVHHALEHTIGLQVPQPGRDHRKCGLRCAGPWACRPDPRVGRVARVDDDFATFVRSALARARDGGRRDGHRRDPGGRYRLRRRTARHSCRPTSARRLSSTTATRPGRRAARDARGDPMTSADPGPTRGGAPAGPLAARAGARDRRRRARRDRAPRGHAVPDRGARLRAEFDRRQVRERVRADAQRSARGPPARRARGGQGHVRAALARAAGRVGPQRDRRRAGRVGRVPAPARCRRGGGRRDQHARARRGVHRPHLRLRAVRQPVGHRALRRRVVRWLSGRGRGPAGGRSGRHRRWRVDPLPGRLLRGNGPEAHLGPRPVRRVHARVLVDERPRAAVPGHGRRTAARRGARRQAARGQPRATPATGHRPRLLGGRGPRDRRAVPGRRRRPARGRA